MTNKQNANEVDLNTLSDEEIMNLDPATFGEPGTGSDDKDSEDSDNSDDTGSQSTDSDSDQDQADVNADGAADDEGSSEETTGGVDSDSSEDDNDSDTSDSDSGDDDASSDDDQSDDDKGDSDSAGDDDESDDLDYEIEYKKLMAPFRAAKREVNLEGSIEDARRLMKMGVDYSRKLEGLKPHLQLVRTLEDAKLLDPKKINFLIDLSNKDPAAIKKLLKDSGIDPMTLDLEGSENYSPTEHGVSRAEFAVRDVLDNIKDDPKFQETVDVIKELSLDEKSKNTLQAKPEVIAELHQHIEAGIYQKVADRVANERLLGRLSGLSSLEAYYQVGDAMFQAGEFNTPKGSTSTSDKSDSARQDSGSTEEKGKGRKNLKTNSKQLRNRKRAAGRTKGKAASGKAIPDFSKMTDAQIEDFDEASLD